MSKEIEATPEQKRLAQMFGRGVRPESKPFSLDELDNFELAEKIPEELHIEKITVAISRNDLKIMLAQRMQNDGAIDNEFNALTDKYCHLFGFMDWLQAYHKL